MIRNIKQVILTNGFSLVMVTTSLIKAFKSKIAEQSIAKSNALMHYLMSAIP